jgi:GDP-L-fucose synthase
MTGLSQVLTAEFLRLNYIQLRKSGQDIAIEIGCKSDTVYKYLRLHNIKTNRGRYRKSLIDLTGQRFGKLVVLKLADQIKKKIVDWKCKCDCGNEAIVSTGQLRSGRTKSCGCFRGRERHVKMCYDVPTHYFNSVKRRASNKDQEFSITLEYVSQLFDKQNHKCALSGLPLSFAKTTRDSRAGGTTASLDRIDSKYGYIPNNVQWVHKRINTIKWDISTDDFIKLCKQVTQQQTANIRDYSIKSNSILILGGTGFVGRNLSTILKNNSQYEIISIGSEFDLRNNDICEDLIGRLKPRYVINLAAKVAGIGGNILSPGDFFRDNALIGINVIHNCYLHKVEKLIQLSSVCGYPATPPLPFKEIDLWLGEAELTNWPYGLAKKSLIVMADAYNKQYGLNTVTLIPTNMYGPLDNYDPINSHIVPALIRKIFLAKSGGGSYITLWGDGTPTRDLLYVEDFCNAVYLSLTSCHKTICMNVGSEKDISITALARSLAKIMNFDGDIRYDCTKPNGQMTRRLSCELIFNEIGWRSQTSLFDGLVKTVNDFNINKERLLA